MSNRLPVSVSNETDNFTLKKSIGGVATGLNSFIDNRNSSEEYIWVGWPGAEVPEHEQQQLKAQLLNLYNYYLVFLTKKQLDGFYVGFCNSTIYPLLTQFPEYTRFDDDYWNSYKQVNNLFCEAILNIAKDGDQIWINDYHLLLLPELLKKKLPHIPISFFLHVPFPPWDSFSHLPSYCRKELFKGMMGSDFIGFHIEDYSSNFFECVKNEFGIIFSNNQANISTRLLTVGACPMGIDYRKFNQSAMGAKVLELKKEMKTQFLEQAKIILSLDRLDYTKGIVNKLLAFEILPE